jgi:hypothetical protein
MTDRKHLSDESIDINGQRQTPAWILENLLKESVFYITWKDGDHGPGTPYFT